MTETFWTDPVAEATPEPEAPTVDPVEAARKVLEEAGYSVAIPEPPAREDDGTAEIAVALASLKAELQALRTEAAKAKATPSGGATTEKPATPQARNEKEKAFDGFAQLVKRKISTR